MRWLIHALTRPGERVVSLFSGVSPCGVAALQFGRSYHGVEVNPVYRRVAEERMAAYGRPAMAPPLESEPVLTAG